MAPPPKPKATSPVTLPVGSFPLTLPPDEAKDKVLVAICKAILHSGANRPSTPKEITACIMENNYAHLGGQTPHATISSRISTHFKKANESNGRRVPLLGRLLNDKNRIKYYVAQFPFEKLDDDYTKVMRPEEPAKPVKNADSQPNNKRNPARRIITNLPEDPASDFGTDMFGEEPVGDIRSARRRASEDLSSSSSESSPGSEMSRERVSESPLTDIQDLPYASSTSLESDPDDIVIEDELDFESPPLPPQNPHQTYTFSPVFQPHIFIRPNITSLPPLSTLHHQTSISHLSPPLISASPAIGATRSGSQQHPTRLFMPSPMLLPSPRGLTLLSPQFGTSSTSLGGLLNPLDLGPGLYSTPRNTAVGGSRNGAVGALPLEDPENISMGELDELLMEHDESAAVAAAAAAAVVVDNKAKRKKSSPVHGGESGTGKRRKSVAKPHQTESAASSSTAASVTHSIGEKGRGTSRPKTLPATGSLESSAAATSNPIVNSILKSPSVFITNPSAPTLPSTSVSTSKPLFEICSIHLSVPSPSPSHAHLPHSSIDQIVTVSRFKSCPIVSMPLHCISVSFEKSAQAPTVSFTVDMKNYIRIGDLVGSYPDPEVYMDTVDDMDAAFVVVWNRFVKNLLQLSGSKDPERPLSPNCEEVDAALSLMELVKPVVVGEDVVGGGESFCVKVVWGGEGGAGKGLFGCDLMVVVVKAGAVGIASECNGIWIPLEIAKYLTNLLQVPPKVNDLYPTDPSSTSTHRRDRTFSISSLSSGTSSRNTSHNHIATSPEGEGFLNFDSSDEGEIDIGNDAVPLSLPLALSRTPSTAPQQQRPPTPGHFPPATSIDPAILTLIPASNFSDSLMWMTTIDGVFVYITWFDTHPPPASPARRSLTPTTDTQQRPPLPSGTGIPILRRVDNGMVNASQLLHAGGLLTEQDKSVILSLERFKKRLRRPDSALRGTWIPLTRARELARTFSMEERLRGFLAEEAGVVGFGVLSGVSPARRNMSGGGGGGGTTPGSVRKVRTPGSVRKKVKPPAFGIGSVQPGRSGSSSLFPSAAAAGLLRPPVYPTGGVGGARVGGERKVNIYPPGSLAAVKFAKAQAAAKAQVMAAQQLAVLEQQAVVGTEISGMVASVLKMEGMHGPVVPEVPQPSPPPRTHGQTIADTESSTRIAVTSLANTLATSTRIHPSLTPPVIAATLAAFATGAKKINESVKSNALSVAPTPVAIMQAFAARVKSRGDGAPVVPWESQFPGIQLADRNVDVLVLLGELVDSTVKIVQAKEDTLSPGVVTPVIIPQPLAVPSPVSLPTLAPDLPYSNGSSMDAVPMAAISSVDETAPGNTAQLDVKMHDEREEGGYSSDSESDLELDSPRGVGGGKGWSGEGGKGGGKNSGVLFHGGKGGGKHSVGGNGVGYGKMGGKAPRSSYHQHSGGGGKSAAMHHGGGGGKSAAVQHGVGGRGKSWPARDTGTVGGKSVSFKEIVEYELNRSDSSSSDSLSLFSSDEERDDRDTLDPELYHDPYRHTLAAKSVRAANAQGGKVRRSDLPVLPQAGQQKPVGAQKKPVVKPKVKHATKPGGATKSPAVMHNSSQHTKKASKVTPAAPMPFVRQLPPESVRVQATDEDEDIDILN
ncbi:hypothetical protein HDU98_007435 [Podochytrium sp. JEL0797]|nr:hypothetical protein HDU98_007435 [Podochytrium sp. JEL0797]